MASRHVVVERGDPFKENIQKCVEMGVMAARRSGRGGRKERAGLHIHKIAEPGIAYCTVCDRMINYTNRGKDALTAD